LRQARSSADYDKASYTAKDVCLYLGISRSRYYELLLKQQRGKEKVSGC